MSIDWVRRYCLSLPHATEQVQWQNELIFKVAGKMFAITSLEPGPAFLSFHCTPENFAELTVRPGIRAAPYLARCHWILLESEGALPARETKTLLGESYDLVVAKLPRRVRTELSKT